MHRRASDDNPGDILRCPHIDIEDIKEPTQPGGCGGSNITNKGGPSTVVKRGGDDGLNRLLQGVIPDHNLQLSARLGASQDTDIQAGSIGGVRKGPDAILANV